MDIKDRVKSYEPLFNQWLFEELVDVYKRQEFVIQDDGPGFSKKDLENATTLFYSSQTNKGSFGIGLSISKILCEKHGGILKLLNNENGACAIVQIKK